MEKKRKYDMQSGFVIVGLHLAHLALYACRLVAPRKYSALLAEVRVLSSLLNSERTSAWLGWLGLGQRV